MDYNYISFPGLGIGEMKINKVAFEIGSLQVRWYGIIITLAMILGFTLACFRAKKKGIDFDNMLDYGIFVIISAIIGARLYYVVFDPDGSYTSFRDVIAIWDGGLAIYGGLIAGFIAIVCVSKYKKINLSVMLDIIAPCAMLGQAIGRWGNFFNAEAYGFDKDRIALYEKLFFRMDIREPGGKMTYHTLPTFLLESIWNILGLLLLILIIEKFKKYEGQSALFYVGWYGLGRGIIETYRSDSLYISSVRVSSLLGFVCFIGCTITMVYLGLKAKRKRLDEKEYVSMYSNRPEDDKEEKSTLFDNDKEG